ncbi:MAG: M56 family metallopeptidase [Phycisphaerae bacterium]|nr:M56 family metallopeptidase [Saprospiraceae bacterium]
MTTFLLKLTLCWGFFALLYTLLLRHETFFRANRAYLLSTAVLGILLAALPGEQIPVPEVDGGIIALPEFAVGIQQVEAATNAWQDLDFLWIAYWAGFSLMAARVLWGLLKIVQMAVRGQSERLRDGCLLVQTEEAKVPFSFFRWVFVPTAPQLPESSKLSGSSIDDTALMLAHERAHAQGWHSADVLFAEALCVVFWFHPIAHWYRRALRTVHEYLADAEASRLSDRKQYGLLLIGQSQSGMPIAFANHFFQSPLKQRLVMLTKKASAPVRAVKFGLLAPVALLFAILFRQAPIIAQAVDEKHLAFVHDLELNGWVATDTVVTFNPETFEETMQLVRISAAPKTDENGKLVYQYAEVQPQFPGGQEALFKFLLENVKYPELAKQNKVEGTVMVSFVIDETGKVIRPFGQINEPNDSKRPLIEEAIRVVQTMPKWSPAQHKGKPVRCSMQLPVKFSLASQATKPNVVDAEYPGGMEAMFKFLSDNTKYPESAKTAKEAGTVVVSFTIQEDGSLADIKHTNSDKALHPDLVTEALRVVQSMPKWKPGLKDGKVLKTELCIPVKFKI